MTHYRLIVDVMCIMDVITIKIPVRLEKKDVMAFLEELKGLAMNGENLIRQIKMECPLCDKVHEIEERARIAKTIIKGEEVYYEETYCFCQDSDEDENEFVTGKMENNNLLNSRNAYRKAHSLLTSDQIVAIRDMYGLSQVDLAKLLGWGEATISRYESKAIQDEAYDNMLRIIKENSLAVLELLQKMRTNLRH